MSAKFEIKLETQTRVKTRRTIDKTRKLSRTSNSSISLGIMISRPVEEVLGIEDLAVSQNEDAEQAQREEALKKELEGVRNLNRVMEGVIAAMSKAKENMDVLSPLFRFGNSSNSFRLWEQQLRMQIDY